MKYTVHVTAAAFAHAEEAYVWLVARTPQHALEWFNNLFATIDSLEENPLRCPIASKNEDPAGQARCLLYGNKHHAYRIIFDVIGDAVHVLDIRHAARDAGP